LKGKFWQKIGYKNKCFNFCCFLLRPMQKASVSTSSYFWQMQKKSQFMSNRFPLRIQEFDIEVPIRLKVSQFFKITFFLFDLFKRKNFLLQPQNVVCMNSISLEDPLLVWEYADQLFCHFKQICSNWQGTFSSQIHFSYKVWMSWKKC
jgi:hypothetical protein